MLVSTVELFLSVAEKRIAQSVFKFSSKGMWWFGAFLPDWVTVLPLLKNCFSFEVPYMIGDLKSPLDGVIGMATI